MKQTKRLIPLLLLMSLIFVACAAPVPAETATQSGGSSETAEVVEEMASDSELVVAVQALPSTLEPIRENSNVMMRILYNMYGTLLEIDADSFDIVPGLAESWERVDNTTLELKLKEGILFHNGEELTAEDVVFSFGPERMFNEEFAGYGNATMFFGTFASVEAVDDYTVRFVSTGPDPLMEQRLTVNTSAIISKKAFEDATDYQEFSLNPVGTGPYQVVEFVTDDFVRMEPFADYAGGEPTYSSVTFQIVPEVGARIAGLVSGEYDAITEITPDLFEQIENNEGTTVVGGPIRNNRVIIYDESDPVLADPNLRLAMNLAIDRQLIVDELFDGRTDVPAGNQFVYYGDMFIEDWEGTAYDPDLAREVLAESAYDGEPIVYRTQPGYYTFQGEIAEIMQSMWADVGINVDVQIMENWTQVLEEEGRQIYDYSSTMMYPDPVGHLWRLWGERGAFQTNNSFVNDEFNELGTILETSLDIDERREAFRRMMEIYQNEDPSGTYLYQLPMFYGVSEDLPWTPGVYEYMDLRPEKLGQ